MNVIHYFRIIMPDLWFKGPGHVLSNYYPCNLFVFGTWYKSVEHAYKTEQAKFLGNNLMAMQIKECSTPFAIYMISKHMKWTRRQRELWFARRLSVMLQILIAKANQVPEYSHFLLAWGKDIMFKERTRHPYWGGMGQGQNMLGYLHVQVKLYCYKQNRLVYETFERIGLNMEQSRPW